MHETPPFTGIGATARSRVVAFVIKELREVLPPTLFFAVGFNLIEFTTQLVLDDYLVRFANFMVATATALVVGKAVLVANLLPFLRRFDTAPLIRPILFKTMVYTLVVLVVRLLERIVEYAIGGGTIDTLEEYISTHFTWHRFAAVQLWIFVLFLIYTSFWQIADRLGHGELTKMFFTVRPKAPQPARPEGSGDGNLKASATRFGFSPGDGHE
jgi:hypothetical protein